MKSIIVLLSFFAFSGFANASLCKLEASVSGVSWKIGVGGTKLSGTGAVLCTKNGKFVLKEIVDVEMSGGGFGLGFAKIAEAKLVSTGVGYVQSSDALTGKFRFVKVGGHLGPIGVDAAGAVYFKAKKQGKNGAAIPFALSWSKGAGLLASVDLMDVVITPIEAEDL